MCIHSRQLSRPQPWPNVPNASDLLRKAHVSYLGIRQLEAIFESHVHEEGIYPWKIDKIDKMHNYNRPSK